MKITVRLVAIFMIICMIFTTACGERVVPEVNENLNFGDKETIHIYNVNDSNNVLVKNGKTDYVVVYPAYLATNSDMLTTLSELRGFFKEATGITLKMYTDEEYTSSDKIISIGKTAQFNGNNVVVDYFKAKDLKRSGFIIKSNGNSVYICGAEILANLYGVYEFLYREFNYQYFFQDCYNIDKNVKDKILYDFAITDVPDVQFRCNGNGEESISAANRYRMRYNTTTDFYVNATGLASTHNYFFYVPKGTYLETKPEWYSSDGQQLCFTRDPDGLANVIFEKMKEVFLEDQNHDYIPFMVNDGGGWCSCSQCIADNDKYEDPTQNYCATQIKFINKLADKLKEWNEEVCPDRELVICIMSYGKLDIPPVQLNSDGKYTVIPEVITDEDGTVISVDSDAYKLRDNVAVQITYGTYLYDMNYKGNDKGIRKIEQWGAITRNLYFWTYSASFANYLLPYNILESRRQFIDKFMDVGCILIFDNGRWDSNYSSDFNALKSYVTARLEWNSQLPLDQLIEEFCDGYFGEASSVMQEMIEEYRSYSAHLYYDKGVTFYLHAGMSDMTEENFPYRKVKEFLTYIDRAYEAIEGVKNTDPERYEVLYKNILREGISYRYLMLSLYANTFDINTLSNEKKQFIDDCNYVGITKSAEYGAIGNVF